MADINSAFNAENGISLNDLLGIFGGTTDPLLGEAAPLGSIYLRSNGQLFQKTGALDTNWTQFSSGGGTVKISSADTTANFLNSKILVSTNLTKTVNNPAGNETVTLDLNNIGTAGTYRSVTTDSKGRVTSGTNPTTLAGYGITDAQALNAVLTSLSGFNTNGLVTQTAANTFTGRTLSGTANQIVVTNGNGVSGNPTLSFPSTSLTFPGTEGIIPPKGTTAQRINTQGFVRFNTDTALLEYYNGASWFSLSSSSSGTVTSVGLVAPSAGISVSGSPVTTSGNITLALSNDLLALEGLSTTGLAVRTGTDTWTNRSVVGVTGKISVLNADGVAGNISVDISGAYAGQTSITTLGTITTGAWNGTSISTGFGGTGLSALGGANMLLGVNNGATGLEYKSLVAGAGISITPSVNALTISASGGSGITAVNGTANQIDVSTLSSVATAKLADNPIIPGLQRVKFPVGSTADRPAAPSAGDHRFNSQTGTPELFNATDWLPYGRVLQVVSGTFTALSGTTLLPFDATIPQITEGFQVLSTTFTPLSTTSTIIFDINSVVSNTTAGRYLTFALFVNGVANAVSASTQYSATASAAYNLRLVHRISSTSKATITLAVRCGANGTGTTYVGQAGATNTLGGTFNKIYTITEII